MIAVKNITIFSHIAENNYPGTGNIAVAERQYVSINCQVRFLAVAGGIVQVNQPPLIISTWVLWPGRCLNGFEAKF